MHHEPVVGAQPTDADVVALLPAPNKGPGLDCFEAIITSLFLSLSLYEVVLLLAWTKCRGWHVAVSNHRR